MLIKIIYIYICLRLHLLFAFAMVFKIVLERPLLHSSFGELVDAYHIDGMSLFNRFNSFGCIFDHSQRYGCRDCDDGVVDFLSNGEYISHLDDDMRALYNSCGVSAEDRSLVEHYDNDSYSMNIDWFYPFRCFRLDNGITFMDKGTYVCEVVKGGDGDGDGDDEITVEYIREIDILTPCCRVSGCTNRVNMLEYNDGYCPSCISGRNSAVGDVLCDEIAAYVDRMTRLKFSVVVEFVERWRLFEKNPHCYLKLNQNRRTLGYFYVRRNGMRSNVVLPYDKNTLMLSELRSIADSTELSRVENGMTVFLLGNELLGDSDTDDTEEEEGDEFYADTDNTGSGSHFLWQEDFA